MKAPVTQRLLRDPELADQAKGLGFHQRDVTELEAAAALVLDEPESIETIERFADRLLDRMGRFELPESDQIFTDGPLNTPAGPGVLPLLALIATAPALAALHAGRGVPADISAATLADLGQQVSVHRLVHGTFGLHSHEWLKLVWSGSLYSIGRLQFNLQLEGDWVLSVHIPRLGPLTPESVDDSFAKATSFFAKHFPDYPTSDFFCRSWLLDPAFAVELPDSNLAAFQRRWRLYGHATRADSDMLFFLFDREGAVDVASLPTNTRLQRLAVARLTSGEGWSIHTGRIAQARSEAFRR